MKPLSILVTEDNEIDQMIARLILERASGQVKVDIAKDGEEALCMFLMNPYDIILMDCQLPNLDGLGTTERIRVLEKELIRRRCSIVALTASKEQKHRCLNAGMDDFLLKPYRGDQLLKLISKWT